MRNRILVLAVIFLLIGMAQAKPTSRPRKVSKGDRIALVDMAEVFKKFEAFTDHREKLKKEVLASAATAKIQREKLTELQGDLKDAVTGSKAARQLQKDLIKKAAEYQTFRKTEQLRFLNQEAAIYKTIYMKVKKVVSEIAAKRGFTLVIRFSHKGVATALDSKTILKRMNRLVVSYDKSIDITETVLKTLNDRYRLAVR